MNDHLSFLVLKYCLKEHVGYVNDSAWDGGSRGGYPPPPHYPTPTPWVGPYLSGLYTKYFGMTQVPGVGMSGSRDEPDQPTGSNFHHHVQDKIFIME